MELKIRLINEVKVIPNILPERYDALLAEGFKIVDGFIMWDYCYMMADDDRAYQAGLKQEKTLKMLGILD